MPGNTSSGLTQTWSERDPSLGQDVTLSADAQRIAVHRHDNRTFALAELAVTPPRVHNDEPKPSMINFG